MSKRVWILGAGFSQPLGAPLLRDFFRPEPLKSCQATFPDPPFGSLANEIFALQIGFYWGREHAGYWEDAEQFLGFVDDAYAGNDHKKKQKIAGLIGEAFRPYYQAADPASVFMCDYVGNSEQLMKRFDIAARRALAAHCECFLFHRSPNDEEAWSPFRRWASRLEAGTDAIITFNYDRVLQELDPKQAKLQILKPDENEDSGKRVPVYRLHGGVDWAVENDRIVTRDAGELLRSEDARIAIAAPGRGKTHFVARHFQSLWERAEKHLPEAEAVFFIGYSFPKSDSEALRRILEALKQRTKAIPRRDIHVVLGAETTSATRRVAALLQTCTAGRWLEMVPAESPLRIYPNVIGRPDEILTIKQHPLWAQDFLGDWEDRATRRLQI